MQTLPVVDGVKAEYEGVVDFAVYRKVNSDSSAGQLASSHGVSAIPTMVLVAPDGTEIDRLVGGTDEAGLRDFLRQASAAP